MELTTNVLIEVFDDRVVISNPGGLPGGLKPADFGTKSVARNQLIASLFTALILLKKSAPASAGFVTPSGKTANRRLRFLMTHSSR